MHTRATPKSLSWPEIVTALRHCAGAAVLVRDGKVTEGAGAVRPRPSAKGTELCLFPDTVGVSRLDLIAQLETLAKGSGRRFMAAARAKIGDSYLLVERVADEDVDGVLHAVVQTRRPTLGFNQSVRSGDTTTFRTKRIKQT